LEAFAGIDRIRRELEGLDREDLRRARRVIDSPQGPWIREGGTNLANFASNDYLGLANDPRVLEAAREAISRYGFGAGASPLVVGHTRAHEEAEQAFAAFTGNPRALLFASGYAANLGILAALADRESAVFADRLDHACLVDGAVLSRAAFHRYPHGDLDALERLLAGSKARTRLIATDAVFSMDGDVAPLPALLQLAERHDAWLVVDDAHGIGVLGGGRGSLAHFGIASGRIVHMATLGKALGGYGAFVTGAPEVVEWLLQRARPYVFSTALPPSAAAAATAALAIVASEPERVERLHARIALLRAGLTAAGLASASPTAIQPILVGEASRAVTLSVRLRERGHLVPAIRPPTVPAGTSRLRVSLSSEHATGQVDALVRDLAEAMAP
jgi:8-amino-7-oxononanoate synthase